MAGSAKRLVLVSVLLAAITSPSGAHDIYTDLKDEVGASSVTIVTAVQRLTEAFTRATGHL